MELTVKEKLYALFTEEEIELLIKADEIEKRVSAIKDARRVALIKFLQENNLTEKGYEDELIKLTYMKPYVRQDVDRKKLQEEGLLELYSKPVNVKESVRITIKYED